MALVVRPPSPVVTAPGSRTVFLAGSIEMGSAPPWQSDFEDALSELPVTIWNPRRPDWDSTWEQSIDDEKLREQVTWELEAQERADIIAMYFAPETRAPVTLLELGLFAGTGRVIVCCPRGYWRKGNVDMVCERYGVREVADLAALVDATVRAVGQR